MGLFDTLFGKTPEVYERQGDALAHDRVWGEAKIAYESGLAIIAKRPSADPKLADRLRRKLHQSKEALALAHLGNAEELMDAGCMEDARELFTLADELTVDPKLKEDLAEKIKQTSVQDIPVTFNYDDVSQAQPAESEAGIFHEDPDDPDEYFSLVLGALPDDVQLAYRSYGRNFEQGYLALNQGDFEQAVHFLIQAAEENTSPLSLVPLELATAYVNLGKVREAQDLLEELVQQQPDLLPAYELLCEIYWEDQNFDMAMQLLDTLPPDLAQSMAAFQIRGETLLQAARYEEARSFFQDLFQDHGWNEPVALGLARAHEALGQTAQARDIYGTLISQCSGCGSRVDPTLKRKYADLSLVMGNYTTEVLEYYLELSQVDPSNAIQYCQNISRIYAELGNDAESKRFQKFAEGLSRRS